MHLDIDMGQAEEWLSHLIAHGRKANSVNTHRNNLRQCFAYLQADGRSYRAEDITVDDIHYLWAAMDVKDSLRMTYLRTLAGMIIHFTGRDVVKQADILFNREVRDRVFISDEEFSLLYMNADPLQRLIMVLGGFMGLRRVEMHGIRDSDIRGNQVTIHGKGHGERGLMMTVVIPGPVMTAMEEYREYRDSLGRGRSDDYLIQTPGRDGWLHRINISRITDTITDLGKVCGIEVTVHSFRRFYATTLYYETGCDVQTLRCLMRHANIATTFKCYVDACDVREREASEKLTGYISGLIGSGT